MRTLLLTLLLLATALAGCASDEGPGTGPTATDTDDDSVTDTGTNPSDDGPPLLQLDDPWGEQDAIQLGTVTSRSTAEGGACLSAADQWYTTCLYIPPGDLEPVPPGAKELQVEVTGPDASYTVSVFPTDLDQWDGGEQTGADLEWVMPLTAEHWEFTPQGHWSMRVYAAGVGGHPEPITGTITAIRDPDWAVPAIIDPWQDPSNHTYTPQGSMVLLQSSDTYDWGGWPNGGPVRADLAAPVPLGTDYLTLGFLLDSVSACDPEFTCNPTFETHFGTLVSWATDREPVPEYGEVWILRTFAASDWPLADSPLREETARWMGLIIYSCDPVSEAQQGSTEDCGGYSTPTGTFDATLLVEAWQGEPDLDAFKERLGVV